MFEPQPGSRVEVKTRYGFACAAVASFWLFEGLILTTAYVTADARLTTAVMYTTKPISPRTVSIRDLE